MKKLMVAVAAMALAITASADVTWSWWMDNKLATPDLSLGIASKCMKVGTAEISLLYSASTVSDGIQWTIFGINDSSSSCAIQLAPWFNRGDDPCVQLGFINMADSACFTMGLINMADNTKVQLGFLNFDKKGFLPVFPFINLSKDLFD